MTRRFDRLVEKLREIHDLRAAESVLGWDQQTYMPPKGNAARSRQSATLSAVAHEKLCDPALGELIVECEAEASLDDDEKALLREAKRDRDKAVKVPTRLVRELTELAGQAHEVWVEARKKDEYSRFAPYLERLVALKTEEAQALGYPADGAPYDALLDQFEPGATVRWLNPIIERTRRIAVAATQALVDAPRKPQAEILRRGYDAERQERISRIVLGKMGYDFEAGRLDKSVHPFTTSFDVRDVRITTRYEENWLPAAVFGSIHEGGHALYEQGLPGEWAGTPLGEATSLGIHESQSRFWENQIGRSLAFWRHFYPELKSLFPAALSGVSVEDFHFAINTVEPSLIRVEADEVTYNLHIIVRYEVEQAMFGGQAKTGDLPELWNAKMKAYLGLVPPTDREGILQDIHWSFGGFGYFPTYLLGNLYAAQWMAQVSAAFPDLETKVARGELLPIRDWLRAAIHGHGRRYSADELSRRIAGESLNPDHFGAYLKARYGSLYNVSWQET